MCDDIIIASFSSRYLPPKEYTQELEPMKLPGRLADYTGNVLYPDENSAVWDVDGKIRNGGEGERGWRGGARRMTAGCVDGSGGGRVLSALDEGGGGGEGRERRGDRGTVLPTA